MTDWRTRFSLLFLGVLLGGALFGPHLVKLYNGASFDGQSLLEGLQNPSTTHPLGTDLLGRDVLSRVLYGSRISLTVGFVATLISTVIGVFYGAIAGYLGGRIDDVMMRVVDVLYCLPDIMLVVILMALFERSMLLLFVALGAVSWLTVARIVRGQVLSLKQEPFVEAAHAMGSSRFRILGRHIIPNAMGTVIAYATLTVPSVILDEAFLSFLGLGIQPPTPSWGVLASEGAQAISVHPILLIAPAMVMALTLLALSFVGETLQSRFERVAGRGAYR
jgi:oligopeptide transport system permease protein